MGPGPTPASGTGHVHVPEAHRFAKRSIPGSMTIGLGMLGLMTLTPLVPLLSVVVLGILTPIARTLASRLMVCVVGAFALAALGTQVALVGWGPGAEFVLLLVALAGHLIVVRAFPSVPVVPRVSAADWLVLVGGGILAAMLWAPFQGASPEDVLLDLARGYDTVNHYTFVANLVTEPSANWEALDGAEAYFHWYPRGFHVVAAAAMLLAGVGEGREILREFAAAIVLATTLSAVVLGMIAVRVAAATGEPSGARLRGVTSAVLFGGVAAVSGVFAAPFQIGHVPFMLPAVAGIAASWLALDVLPRSRPTAILVLLCGAVGLLGAYPPLAIGLAPACLVAAGLVGSSRRTGILVGLGAGLGLVVFAFRDRIEHLITAGGEFSTLLGVSFFMVAVTLVLAWGAKDRGYGQSSGRALLVVAGYGTGAAAIAVGAATTETGVAASYYAAKMGEAAWLGALPVLMGLMAWVLTSATSRLGSSLRAPALVGGLVIVIVGVGFLPVGRNPGHLGGPVILGQRLLEAKRAAGQVQVVSASELAGPSEGDVSLMVDPGGWFYRFTSEDGLESDWQRNASLASQWMGALRGVPSEEGHPVTYCMVRRGGAEAIPCVEKWLDGGVARRATIAVGEDSALMAPYEALSGRHPGQVRIVEIPPATR